MPKQDEGEHVYDRSSKFDNFAMVVKDFYFVIVVLENSLQKFNFHKGQSLSMHYQWGCY